MSFFLLSSPHRFCCSTAVRVYLCLCFLSATYAHHLWLIRIWEEVVISLSFILFKLLLLLPLTSRCTGEWKKEFSQIYAFSFMYSCMCLGILLLGPSLLSSYLKFHHTLCFPGFSDGRMIMCTWSVSTSATCSLWVAVGLTSCCLFCGVAASVALRNRKRNWLLYRLRAGGGLLSAVSPEDCIFHAGSFPCELSVPYAK